MAFNPDDFAPNKSGFNPDDFLPSKKSGFNPDDFLPKEQTQGFNPDGFLPVTQNDFKAAIPEIVSQLKASLITGAEFTPEQMQSPLKNNLSQQEVVLPPIDGEPARPMGVTSEQVVKTIYNPEDPLGVKGMQELGSAAYAKGMGQQVSPEQTKALEDFTVENFKGIVLYPAAITGAAQAVGWYIANRTLPGSIRAAREAVAKALRANGVPEAQASRMADEGMTQAVAKAQAAGAEPGIPEFVAIRKAAQRGITPKEKTTNVPAVAEPTAAPARPVEEPLPMVEAKAPESVQPLSTVKTEEYGASEIPAEAPTQKEPEWMQTREGPEWEAYAAEQNRISREQGQKRVVDKWRSEGAAGNDIANLLRSKDVNIPESIAKVLSDEDTTVSIREVSGRGLKKPEARRIHRWVSENMAPLMPAEPTPVAAPDWQYVDAVKDPFRKYSWLEKIANSSTKEVTDTALSGVLDRIEKLEPEVGSDAWGVAWDVAQNPKASPATKARALALRDKWMAPGREAAPETFEQKLEKIGELQERIKAKAMVYQGELKSEVGRAIGVPSDNLDLSYNAWAQIRDAYTSGDLSKAKELAIKFRPNTPIETPLFETQETVGEFSPIGNGYEKGTFNLYDEGGNIAGTEQRIKAPNGAVISRGLDSKGREYFEVEGDIKQVSGITNIESGGTLSLNRPGLKKLFSGLFQPESVPPQIEAPKKQELGVHLRGAQEGGVEAAKGEVKPKDVITGKPVELKVFRGESGKRTDAGDYGKGIYFTGDIERAGAYGKVGEHLVKLNNPKVFHSSTEARKWRREIVGDELLDNPQSEEASLLIDSKLRSEGHDGVVVYDSEGKFTSVPDLPFEVVKLGEIPPPPAPPVEKPAPMSDDDWVAKFRKDLANAKPEVELQNMMYSEERAKRFAAATNAYTLSGGGFEGAKAALGQLKGALEKRAFESLTKTINQEGVDRLTRIIFSSPNLKTMGDRLSAFDGFERIMQGRLPQEAQIPKLQRVFGKELVKIIDDKRPWLKKAYDLGLQIVNMPRSLMASADISFPFRQGIFFVSRPQFWGKAWPDMIKSLKSEADFKALQEAIENDPDYPMLKEKGLDLTGMSTVMGEREEDFAAPLIEREVVIKLNRLFDMMGIKLPESIKKRDIWFNANVPGSIVRASGRAYVAFGNKLRLDVAKSLLKSAQDSGFKPTEDLVEKIVRYVNAGTGRGGLGPLQGAATALNTVFFSPRLMASRVNLMTKLLQPSFYEKNNAFIRQQYWRDALGFLAFGSTIMGIAKMAGADVGLDPRSSDFGKIKIRNTRLDVWGGFQQYARMLGQLVAGEYVSSITGKVMTLGEGYKPLTRKDILQRQVESKLSPTASFVNTMLKGQDWEGKPVSAKKEVAERSKPLSVSELYNIITTDPALTPLATMGLIGFGVQTYGEGKPVDYRKMAQSMSFQDIAKTLEITEDPKARTQLFQAALKKFPAAIRKAEDKEEVKRIRAKMVDAYHKKK